MKPERKKKLLTDKEAEIMQMLWEGKPLFVRELLDRYPEPKPHFNTVSTTVRILEDKGYVGHEAIGGSHRYFAIADMTDFRRQSLSEVVGNYFNNSYRNAVSSLVEDEKISVDELREIIDMIENRNNK